MRKVLKAGREWVGDKGREDVGRKGGIVYGTNYYDNTTM